ncbi:MAG: hypothetical protein AB4041_06980 [Microcystaceae cyanobacterium]
MTPSSLTPDTLSFLLSLVLPVGCRLKIVSELTYRIYCPDYRLAEKVWQNIPHCLDPLLVQGSIVEVVASDYYARSHPKSNK